MSCGVGRRHGSDPVLLWLWRRLAATAPIRPLAWEPSYAARVALEMAKKKKQTHFSHIEFLPQQRDVPFLFSILQQRPRQRVVKQHVQVRQLVNSQVKPPDS